MSAHSLRTLAHTLNLSHATVSEALRGSSRVKTSTRLRVEAEAARLGYRRNPLASALMTELRRSRGTTFRGLLGAIAADVPDPDQADILSAARHRAERLGFKLDTLRIPSGPAAAEKLAALVSARGIGGLLLLPARDSSHLRGLDWSRILAVGVDHEPEAPCFHLIGPDRQKAMKTALHELRTRGYRRPGLVLLRDAPPESSLCWSAAFHAYPHGHYGVSPPLMLDRNDRPAFERWLRTTDHDVVLAPFPAPGEWIKPIDTSRRHVGFCCLDRPAAGAEGCAGLSLRPDVLGELATELLAEKILRGERGATTHRLSSTFAPSWIDGDSLRARPA